MFSKVAARPMAFGCIDTDVLCGECMSGFYIQAKSDLDSGYSADIGDMGCGAHFGKKNPASILTTANANGTATASGGPFKAMLRVDPTATISISTVVQAITQIGTVTAAGDAKPPSPKRLATKLPVTGSERRPSGA